VHRLKWFSLFVFACVPTLLAQTPTLTPGQYEVEMSTSGGPAGRPPRKDTHCYTPEELKELPKLFAGGGQAANGCKVDSKTTGKTLSFTTVCASGTTASGEVTFLSNESYKVVMTMKPGRRRAGAPDGPEPTMTITAHRVGACPK
jgi:hypothetical protein